jgi:ankyrin repeat protein
MRQRCRHAAVVGALVGGGAAVGAVDEEGYTALHAAADYGHAAVVEALVGAGAGVDPIWEAHTPLSWAAICGNAEVAAALLGEGADATRPTEQGKTAAEWARERGHAAVAQLIEAHLAALKAATQKKAPPKKALGQAAAQ